jgi:hypothetical protein
LDLSESKDLAVEANRGFQVMGQVANVMNGVDRERLCHGSAFGVIPGV